MFLCARWFFSGLVLATWYATWFSESFVLSYSRRSGYRSYDSTMDVNAQVWPVAGGFHATAEGLPIAVYGRTQEEAALALEDAQQRMMRLSLLVAAKAGPPDAQEVTAE